MGAKIGLNCNNSNLEGYFNARRVYFNAVHPSKGPPGPGAKIGPAAYHARRPGGRIVK